MSISDKITRLSNAKTSISQAITNKGGTVSSGDGFEDFANDISTIPTGITPTGTKTITENGTYDVTNFANASVSVQSGGYDFQIGACGLATTIPSSCFYSTKINYADFPNATILQEGAFMYCKSMTTAKLPKVTTVNNQVFYNCTLLASITFNDLITFKNYTGSTTNPFPFCSALSTVNLPACQTIWSHTFNSVPVKNLTAPNLKTIGDLGLAYTKITEANFTNLSTTGVNAFYYCPSILRANLPALKSANSYLFQGCASLTTVSIPACSYIYTAAFSGCKSLASLYLGDNCTLATSAAFTGTKLASKTGKIYVPTSKVEAYKKSAQWSYFSTIFNGY